MMSDLGILLADLEDEPGGQSCAEGLQNHDVQRSWPFPKAIPRLFRDGRVACIRAYPTETCCARRKVSVSSFLPTRRCEPHADAKTAAQTITHVTGQFTGKPIKQIPHG